MSSANYANPLERELDLAVEARNTERFARSFAESITCAR
jgi:predicted unusual protein kinase regulating ubiquinone biosynthesis (AarF/ABC1/UbiB family)